MLNGQVKTALSVWQVLCEGAELSNPIPQLSVPNVCQRTDLSVDQFEDVLRQLVRLNMVALLNVDELTEITTTNRKCNWHGLLILTRHGGQSQLLRVFLAKELAPRLAAEYQLMKIRHANLPNVIAELEAQLGAQTIQRDQLGDVLHFKQRTLAQYGNPKPIQSMRDDWLRMRFRPLVQIEGLRFLGDLETLRVRRRTNVIDYAKQFGLADEVLRMMSELSDEELHKEYKQLVRAWEELQTAEMIAKLENSMSECDIKIQLLRCKVHEAELELRQCETFQEEVPVVLGALSNLTSDVHIYERGSIPRSVKREVWGRDRGRCVECGGQARLEYDHIIPVSKGGANTTRNIQLLCETCNRRKSNQI